MSDREREDTRALWNRVADDWRIQVGDDGDANRRLNSDPVLWAFAGDVRGRTVLDAGCGPGDVSKQRHARGARVIGLDFAERMIAIARGLHPELDIRVDDGAELRTIADADCDLVIVNYVLMDTPDLPGTMAAFHRVLKPGGVCRGGFRGTAGDARPLSPRQDRQRAQEQPEPSLFGGLQTAEDG